MCYHVLITTKIALNYEGAVKNINKTRNEISEKNDWAMTIYCCKMCK